MIGLVISCPNNTTVNIGICLVILMLKGLTEQNNCAKVFRSLRYLTGQRFSRGVIFNRNNITTFAFAYALYAARKKGETVWETFPPLSF